MSNIEKIKIVKLGRKQQPSKFKPGEMYSITTIMDDKNRKLTSMGKWGEEWKVGDEIEAIIEEKKWTDKDGFEQVGLNLKDPNQKPFTPRSGGGSYMNPIVVSYQLAAALAPLFFSDKKKITLADVDKLAEELKKRIEVTSTPSSTQTETTETTETPKKKEVKVPEVNVNEDVEDDEDDDRPF